MNTTRLTQTLLTRFQIRAYNARLESARLDGANAPHARAFADWERRSAHDHVTRPQGADACIFTKR